MRKKISRSKTPLPKELPPQSHPAKLADWPAPFAKHPIVGKALLLLREDREVKEKLLKIVHALKERKRLKPAQHYALLAIADPAFREAGRPRLKSLVNGINLADTAKGKDLLGDLLAVAPSVMLCGWLRKRRDERRGVGKDLGRLSARYKAIARSLDRDPFISARKRIACQAETEDLADLFKDMSTDLRGIPGKDFLREMGITHSDAVSVSKQGFWLPAISQIEARHKLSLMQTLALLYLAYPSYLPKPTRGLAARVKKRLARTNP